MASGNGSNIEEIVKCEKCKKHVAEIHCQTCKISLCQHCINLHIISQLTIIHTIISYEQKDKTTKHRHCPDHFGFKIELHCKNCNKSICSQCCSDAHQQHVFKDIKKVYEVQFGIIKRDVDIIENCIIPEFKNIVKTIKNEISKLSADCEKLRLSVSEQGRKWHEAIDSIIKRYISKIDEMETANLKTLKTQMAEMKKALSFLHETKLNNINILESNDGCQLLDYQSEIEKFRKIPLVPHITPPTFTQKQLSEDNLYRQFATLVPSVETFHESYKKKAIFPKDVAIIKTGYSSMWRVSCASTDQVWINPFPRSVMRLIDVQGSLCKTVATDSRYPPYDLTVNDQGHLVFTVRCEGKGVYKMANGNIVPTIISQKWKTLGICATSDGDLLVCMTRKYDTESKVVRYRGSTVKQKIMYDDKGQPLYGTSDLFVTESRFKDIWVSDGKAEAVVVTDHSGKLRFRYTGNLESQKYKSFYPFCIDSDNQGHVLVIDLYSKCVHIVDDNGHLLCYIHNMQSPWGLSVDCENCAWVCENKKGNIKVIKYIH